MDEGNSNALILPAKKKSKNQNSKTQMRSCQNKKLSKSQKKKLKKLEEEKEKKKLLAKSLETLERCKIPEDAYSLLLSSQTIGQAVTSKEKRRREVQFSKAGLEVPECNSLAKRRKPDLCEREDDACGSSPLEAPDNSAFLQPARVESIGREDTSASCVPSQGPDNVIRDSGERGASGPNLSIVDVAVANEDTSKGMNSDSVSSSFCHSIEDDNKSVALADEEACDSRANSSRANCVRGDQTPRPLVAPTVVHVSRPKEIEIARKGLPIIMMEQEIMEAINKHISVIICGKTGCGKTTQVPQFLYEAGYGSTKSGMRSGVIGVTQPRRVAVLSTATRVAKELGLRLGKEVGFQVRHDKRIGENCSIKFMTDGILLRELQSDLLLKRYSVLILDEAHERSLNTDILIGMLSRVIQLRQKIYNDQQQKMLAGENILSEDRIFPLKLILMSATLRVEDFTSGRRIFPDPPPLIEIPTRQFPVVKHFAKKTELVDYIGEAYKKVLKIHKRLPPGGILVFVTGWREVENLCHKLRNASKQFHARVAEVKKDKEATAPIKIDHIDGCDMKEINEALDAHSSSVERQTGRFRSFDEYDEKLDDIDSYSSEESGLDSESETDSDVEEISDLNLSEVDRDMDDFSVNVDLDALKAKFEALSRKTVVGTEQGEKEINFPTSLVCSNVSSPCMTKEDRGEKGHCVGSLRILPLYAMLSADKQLSVFEESKEGERLVVVATNVAETSLTIPGIKYVVDTGREKVKKYNLSNGMESYEIQWISKASADQRAGRAGRTGPGHCYCLYSSAAFTNEFPEFSCAEILKTPIDYVVLLLKSMSISKVANFPFPTPPDATALVEAEKCLKALQALDSDGRLTALGKTMAHFPLSPRHSRLLLIAIQITKKANSCVRHNLVLGYALAVASALSSSNPFLFNFDSSQTNTEETSSGKNQDQQDKVRRKQTKQAAKLSLEKFSNRRSDALTVAYALQCFEQSENPSNFCTKFALNLKTMQEMSNLRRQLLQVVFNQRYSGMQEEFSWTLGTLKDVEDSWKVSSDKNPLSEIEENILCQAICAGWADRVAKKVRSRNIRQAEGEKKINAVAYQASMVEETLVYLSRWSSISASAPDFLVYNEMLHTKRAYIHVATSVDPEWLVKYAGSLCTFSAPSEDRKPFYDPKTDQVVCSVIPYFGSHSWELHSCNVPVKDVQQRVAVFACALLYGHVLPSLKSVEKFRAASPDSFLKPEGLGQKRVGNLISKLRTRSRTIDSRAALRDAWRENPQMLYSEIRDWYQDKIGGLFNECWKEMHREAFQDRIKKKKKHHEKS